MNLEPSTSSSTATSGVSSRQKDKIFLIGYTSYQITGSKLPSDGQVLSSLFYNKRHVKLETRYAGSQSRKLYFLGRKLRYQPNI